MLEVDRGILVAEHGGRAIARADEILDGLPRIAERRREFGVLPPGDLRMALAALCGDDCTELGMTIAYLKRGLKAANDALDAAARLAEEKKMAVRQRVTLNKLLFRVRDRIVDLMSEYRAEWRKRYGNS